MAETFNRSSTKLSSTSITDIYQAPNNASSNRAVILSVMLANVDGATAVDMTVAVTDSSNTELSKIANTISVPADSTLELISNKLVLKQGEKLRATAGAANDCDVTVSVLELT